MSIVKLVVSKSIPNLEEPWHVNTLTVGQGTGFAISFKSNKYIMTCYHVVRHAIHIHNKEIGDLEIAYFCHDYDLALLKYSNNVKLVPIEFDQLQKYATTVKVKGYPNNDSDNLCITKGVINRFIEGIYYSGRLFPTYQIDATINQSNSGGPVMLKNRKCIGVAYAHDTVAINTFYVIPEFVIRNFLDRITNSKEISIPYFTVNYIKLGHKRIRQYHNLKDHGVLLSQHYHNLQKNDILLSANNIPINYDGTFTYNKNKLNLESIVCFTNSDKLKVDYRRKDVDLTSNVKLTYQNKKQKGLYYIYAGFIFIEEGGKVILKNVIQNQHTVGYTNLNSQLLLIGKETINSILDLYKICEHDIRTDLKFEFENDIIIIKSSIRESRDLAKTHLNIKYTNING